MMNGSEIAATAIREFERLADEVDARRAAVLANSMAEAVAIEKLAADARSALRTARLKDPFTPIAPIIAPLLRAVHGERATSLDEAPTPRRVSIPDNGLLIGGGDVPTLAGSSTTAGFPPTLNYPRCGRCFPAVS